MGGAQGNRLEVYKSGTCSTLSPPPFLTHAREENWTNYKCSCSASRSILVSSMTSEGSVGSYDNASDITEA